MSALRMLPGLGPTLLAIDNPGLNSDLRLGACLASTALPLEGCCDLTKRLGFLVIPQRVGCACLGTACRGRSRGQS